MARNGILKSNKFIPPTNIKGRSSLTRFVDLLTVLANTVSSVKYLYVVYIIDLGCTLHHCCRKRNNFFSLFWNILNTKPYLYRAFGNTLFPGRIPVISTLLLELGFSEPVQWHQTFNIKDNQVRFQTEETVLDFDKVRMFVLEFVTLLRDRNTAVRSSAELAFGFMLQLHRNDQLLGWACLKIKTLCHRRPFCTDDYFSIRNIFFSIFYKKSLLMTQRNLVIGPVVLIKYPTWIQW